MRVLGLDIGDRRIGVAVSDPMGWTAQGVCVIQRTAPEKDLQAINSIVTELGVSCVVCGLPVNMNGTYGPQTEKVASFCELIRDATGLPVELWDERLTTVAAERVLDEAGLTWRKKRRVVDMTAACLILQSYLDSRRPGDQG
ncbi:MAG: Holliday junction resolvase RuvX [Bacillota bacterium]